MGKEINTGINEGAPGAGASAAQDTTGEGSQSTLERIQNMYRLARDGTHDWRIEAKDSFDFYAGRQWSEEDAELLRSQLRPTITFNRSAVVIESVAGLEAGNRQETRFIPRQLGATQVNEVLTGAGDWARDRCNAEDEESDAFVDMVVTGMGWTDTRLDYEEDLDGMIKIERMDPIEMYWDTSSKQRNLSDARYMLRVRDYAIDVARDMFPGVNINDLNATWADDTGVSSSPHDAMEAPYYRIDQSGEIDRTQSKVRLVEAQWYDFEKIVRIVNPEDPSALKTLTVEEFEAYEKRAKESQELQGLPTSSVEHVKQRRRAYHRSVCGAVELKEWDGPKEGGFTWKCMTGKRDRNKSIWYGLMRAMIDPQKWSNKWMSQILHIINSQAKGGVMAERGAFDNPTEAQNEWAKPDAITWMKTGALSGANPKVKEKPQMVWPQALGQMLEFGVSSIRDSTGVNLELLGLVDREQAGVLEHQRKQAGMTVLAGLFNALRQYRKDQGRLMLYYITNFLSDGRLIKINGPESAKYVPLVRQPDTITYDVIVDDSPTSPNQKEATWMVLMQMFPMLSRLPIPGEVWMEALKYSPLPATFTEKVGAIMQQAQQNQKPSPEEKFAEGKAQESVARARNLDADTQSKGLEFKLRFAELAAKQGQDGGADPKDELDRMEQIADIEQKRTAALLNLAKAGGATTDREAAALVALIQSFDTLQRARVDTHVALNPAPIPQAGVK